MKPNKIVEEIVTRLQLGGGLCDIQPESREGWYVKTKSGLGHLFTDLRNVAEVIRELTPRVDWEIKPTPGGRFTARIERFGTIDDYPTEAEALTHALLEYLSGINIGARHLEAANPWIDVSESVSMANLPEDDMKCEVDNGAEKETGWLWDGVMYKWRLGEFNRRPKALGGSVLKWRYAK